MIYLSKHNGNIKKLPVAILSLVVILEKPNSAIPLSLNNVPSLAVNCSFIGVGCLAQGWE